MVKRKSIDLSCCLIVFLQVLILFAPEFTFFPKYTWLIAFCGLAVIGYSGFNKCIICKKNLYELIFLIAMNICWSLVCILANGTSDYSYIVYLFGTLLSVLRAVFLVYVIIKNTNPQESVFVRYLEIYIYACVVYVLFTVLFIVIPEFKAFWLSEVIYAKEMSYYAYEFRYSLNGFAAFSASSTFSIAVIINAYLVVHYRQMKKQFRKFFFTYLVCIVGCFFYGRITIIAIFLSLVYVLVMLFRKKQLFRLGAWAGISVCILTIILSTLTKNNQSFLYWKDWAFAIVNQLFSGEGVTDYSVTHMFKEMYYWPKLKTLLIGDGQYTTTMGSYYGATDVGFMRAILFFGVLGCIVNYIMVYVYVIKCYGMLRKRKAEKALIILLGIILIVLEMKGEAYHQLLMAIVPILHLTAYENRKYVGDKKFMENRGA